MDKKKFKLRFNLFDGIVILLALAIAAGVVFYARRKNAAPAEGEQTARAVQVTVHYTLEIEQAYEEAAELAKAGDALYERTKRQYMGTADSVEILPSVVLVKDTLNGKFAYEEVPDRKNIKMQMTAQGTRTEEGITLDSGLEIRVGDSLRVYGNGYYGTGYVTRMERS